MLGIQGILSRFQKTLLSSLSPTFSTPQTLWALAPTPAMAPGAPSSSPSPILAALLFSSLGKWNPEIQVFSQQLLLVPTVLFTASESRKGVLC